MRSLVVALLVVLAAAGASGSSGWQVTALPVSGPHSFSEPGVAARADGHAIVNACTANSGAPSTYWTSADGGRRWSTGFAIGSSAIGCGDSDAVFGQDGWWYALTLGTGVSIYRSHDGRRWTGPASFPPPHGEDQPDRPWLVTTPRTVYLFNSEGGGDIVAWRSTDHGATFTGPALVTGGLNSQAALTLGSRPLVDPRDSNHLQLFYETASLAGLTDPVQTAFPLSQLWVASSSDGGATWSNKLVLDVQQAFGTPGTLGHLLPATAQDSRGETYVVLSVQLGSSPQTPLYLLRSTATGWSKPLLISTGRPSNVMPALAVTSPGHVVISLYASASADSASSGASWDELVVSGPPYRVSRLAGPVHVGEIESLGAVGNDLGRNWAMRDFQSITVDAHGRVLVTWASDYRSQRTYVGVLSR